MGRRRCYLAVAAWFALVLLGMPGAHPPARAAVATELTVSLTGHSPTVLNPTDSLVLTGTVTNSGTEPAALGSIRTSQEVVTLSEPEQLHQWLAGVGASATPQLIQSTIAPATLAPGASHPFTVTIPAAARLGAAPYGSLALRIQAGTATARTFAAYHKVKEYEPLRMAVLLPLTLPADPDLWSRTATTRERAWGQTLAEQGQLNQLMTGSAGTKASWAVDPTLLAAESISTSVTDAEYTLRSQFATTLTRSSLAHDLQVLPAADADLSALSDRPDLREDAPRALRAALTQAAALTASADLVWPVEPTLAFAATSRDWFAGLAAPKAPIMVTSSDRFTSAPTTARLTLPGDTPALSSDAGLTAAFAQASASAAQPADIQTLLAYTALTLNQRPGTARTALIALPRNTPVGASQLKATLTALAGTPWITTASITDLKNATADTAPPDLVEPAILAQATPLTAARARAVDAARDTLDAARSVRADAQSMGPTWASEFSQALSVRFRAAGGVSNATGWQSVTAPLIADAMATRTGLRIDMQDVTFLAESGRLSVTIHNDLAVGVENLTLTLASNNPRLRLDRGSVTDLKIGPGSKTVATFEASALATGQVELQGRLTGPDQALLAPIAESTVAVTPTGSWIYLVIGAVAALALIVGVWRTLRSPRKAGL